MLFVLIVAGWDIAIVACHIPGVCNGVAYAISRNNLPFLFSKVLGISPLQATIPPSLPGKATDDGTTRLDVQQLEETVQQLFEAGLAQSTHKSYRSWERHYLQFCMETNQSPYPVSEQGLSEFIAFFFQL